jgi:hypothetical protein
MSLSDIVKSATAAVVPQTLEGLAASTVTTTRYVQTRDAANRPINTPTNPIVDGSWYITEIADAHAQRIYGLQSAAAAEALLPLDTDVKAGDVVRVTAGDYAGEKYEVEQFVRDPLANMRRVALAPTGKTGL